MSQSVPLICHPNTPAEWLESLQVNVSLEASGALKLVFAARGDLERLVLPVPQARRHTDGLWLHTCFETFIVGADAPSYREFNFSPSRAWAGYLFSAYRQDPQAIEMPDPAILCRFDEHAMSLSALITENTLPPGDRLQIGLSAVIEDRAGTLSYWALNHNQAEPDFHDAGSQVLELQRP